jgi:hypothetical protein
VDPGGGPGCWEVISIWEGERIIYMCRVIGVVVGTCDGQIYILNLSVGGLLGRRDEYIMIGLGPLH